MTSVRHTNGDYLSGVTPTQTGNWTICCWIKIATYGGDQGIIACNDGDVGWDLRVSSTAIAIHIFNDFSGTTTNVITGSDTDWIAVGLRHTSGSDQIDVSTWKVGQGSLTTVSDSFNGWQSANTNYIGQDGFGAMLVDGSTRNFFARADRLSDSDLLTAMQSLTAPAGTNLVYLDLDSPTNAGVNAGTGSNYTVVGTLQTDPTEPPLTPVFGVDTFSPADNALDVSLTPTFTLTFNENIQAGTGNFELYSLPGDTLIESFDVTSDVSISSDEVSFTPSSPLSYLTNYYILADSGVIEALDDSEAWTGISIATTWNFRTINNPAAQIQAAVGSFNTVGASTTDITISGLSFQPKALILWMSGEIGTTDSITKQNHKRSFGFAVSSNSRATVSSQSEDAQATVDCDSRGRTDACLEALGINAAGTDGLLDLSSFNSDGFTLAVDDAFTTNYRISYLAIGGDALTDAFIGSITEPGAAGDQSITGVGFDPDAVIFISAMTTNTNITADSGCMIGTAAGSTPSNAVWAGGSNNGAGAGQTISYCRAGDCIALFNAGITALNARASITAWTSDGFTLNWAARASTRLIYYIALKGGNWVLGDLLTQTDTVTAITESGFGFRPAGALLLSHGKSQSASNTVQDHDEWSMGAFTSTSSRVAQAIYDDDAADPTECASAVEHDNVYINISNTQAIEGAMNVQSVGSDGFSCIMTDADPAQAFVWYLAVGNIENNQTGNATFFGCNF